MNNYTHDILLGLKYVLSALTAVYMIKTIKEMYQFQHPPQRVINMHGGVINVFMASDDDTNDVNDEDDDVNSGDDNNINNVNDNDINDILSDFGINMIDTVLNDISNDTVLNDTVLNDTSNDTPNDVAPNDGSCDEVNVAKSSDDTDDIVLLSDDSDNNITHQQHTYSDEPTQATTLGFSQLVPNFIHESANF